MRKFVLDTCVILALLKEQGIYEQIENDLELDKDDIAVILPISVKAELFSIAYRNGWGEKKLNILHKLLSDFFLYPPDNKILDAYVLIDVFSLNKLKNQPLGKSIKMGKNDIWIAATAVTLKSTLITLDGDFKHLIGKSLNGLEFDIKTY